MMKNRLNDKGFGVVEVLLVIVILGILSFVGYRAYQVYTAQNDDSPLSQLGEDKNLAPEDITAKIKEAIATKYSIVDKAPKEGEVSVSTQKRSPAYKSKGYDFYTDYDGGSSIRFQSYDSEDSLPTAAEKSIRKEVADIYKDFGLTQKASYGPEESTDVYEGKGVVCTVNNPNVADSPSFASCGVINEYKAAAAEVKPFFDALPADEADGSTVLGDIKINNSKVEGYQRASASLSTVDDFGGHVGLFYRKGSGEWQYFTGSQSVLDCKNYDTPDLKNAFKGEPCYLYDVQGEGFVE